MNNDLDETTQRAVSDNSYIARLKRTKKQEVLDIIDAIQYENRYGTSAMMGPYTASETEREYKKILDALSSVPGLTNDEIIELTEIINKAISEIPKTEKAKEDDYIQYEERKEAAFESAKARFGSLSKAKQLKLRLAGKAPENIDKDWTSIEKLEEMYRD